jgi:hypothetical protein
VSDQVLRDAARLLRGGAPLGVFVGALDPSTLDTLREECKAEKFRRACPEGKCPLCRERVSFDPGTGGPVCCCKECWTDAGTDWQAGDAYGADGEVGRWQTCNGCPHRVPS